jgi:PknH-like extracellular domain
VLRVSEAVVALPTAADAIAVLGKFSQQWEKCHGQTVTTEPGYVVFSDKVTDVRVADSVLSATVLHEMRVSGFPPTSSPVARPLVSG